MKTALAEPSPNHYATCSGLLPERSPNSPEVRYCQDHWWAEQTRLWLAGEPVARSVVPTMERRHGVRK